MIRLAIAIAACLALAGLWWHGFKRGERADKQRSDLVISGMVNDAQSRLAEANEKTRLLSASLQRRTDDAAQALQSERSRNERRLADAVATDRLVRDELASFAGGGGSGDDPAASCVSRAQSLGRVLGGLLSDLSACAAGAEGEADGARALLQAWPVMK